MNEKSSRERSKSALVRAVCRNCGTPTVGPYCHMCGQDVTAGRRHRLREIAGDSLSTIFALDNKILRTMGNLVAFPGRLTKEFYDGRIVRYVYPSKMFWFITIVFFALMWSGKTFDDKPSQETDSGVKMETVFPSVKPPVAESPADLSASPQTSPPTADDSLFTRQDLQRFIVSWTPYMVLLFMPVFALLVWLFYPRRERTYSDYLVFSLHFNSMVFLTLAAGIAVGLLFPDVDIIAWLVCLVLPLYFAVSLRRVFGARVVPMIFKIGLIGLLYVILMAAVFFMSLIVFLVFIRKIDIFA